MNTTNDEKIPESGSASYVHVDPELAPEIERFLKDDHRGNTTRAVNALIMYGLAWWKTTRGGNIDVPNHPMGLPER